MAEDAELFEELPLDSVGVRLRRARDSAGLSLSDIAARTKIAERHLKSIETDDYNALASRAYAVGFARSYAKTVGLDERAIAASVRETIAASEPVRERFASNSFEPGDPARVPSARLAWLAALAAFAIIFIGFIFWRSYYAPAQPLPNLAGEVKPATASASQPPIASAASGIAVPAAAQPAINGPVVFTALQAGIWVKFYDSAGNQLMQKQMALGETYTVPADANGPMLWTGRPDALQITIGGRPVAKLAEREGRIKDVPVTAQALLARAQAPATPLAAPAISPMAPSVSPTPQSSTVSP